MAATRHNHRVKYARSVAAYILLISTIALFAASSLMSLSRTERQNDELFVERSSLLWLATSLELEFLRFVTAFTEYRLAPSPRAKTETSARLDLLWSRIPVLNEGREAEPLRQMAGYYPMSRATQEVLEQCDVLITQKAFDQAALDGLAKDLNRVQRQIHQFLITANLSDELRIDSQQDRLRSLQNSLVGSILAMLLSGAILVALLIGQIRKSRRLLDTATVAREQAELQSHALQTEMSERKRATAALEYSEKRFKDFAETAADWFWETASDGRFCYLSDRFQEVMGLPPQQMLERSIDNLCENATGTLTIPRGVTAKGDEPHRPFEEVEVEWRRPDHQTRYLSISGRPVFDSAGHFDGFRGITRDITDARLLAVQMTHQASHDALTGLVNRREFESRLGRALSDCRQQKSTHALCYLDLDQFKIVNDTCGHVAGDALLQQLSDVLSHCIRKRDTLSRLGGDEFGVLLEHCNLEQAHRVANDMRKAIEDFRFVFDQRSFQLSVSIGLVSIHESSVSLTALLAAADNACYAAKDEGRNQIHVFSENDSELARRRGEMQWLAHIQCALDSNRFMLMAHDIQDVAGNQTSNHFEVLLRMLDEDGKIIPPGAFLPAAERYHLSPKLDRWVIQNALDWLAQWNEDLPDYGHCFINLSGLSLGDSQMLEYIVDRFEHIGVPYHRVCFEVTETAAISNMANAAKFFAELRRRGCRFALDDFGSGLSSFGYLRKLPVDFLKIDGLFVKDVVDDPIDFAMVRSINEIGQMMGKKTVAEFVENEQILQKLREIGIDYAQGYHFCHPTPLHERLPAIEDKRPAIPTRALRQAQAKYGTAVG